MPTARPAETGRRRAVLHRRRPSRIDVLLISRAVLEPIEEHLRATGRHGQEEVALLSGYVWRAGQAWVGLATTALLPYTEHVRAGATVPLDVVAGCVSFARRQGQVLLAQIHTHPGRWVDHSSTDDAGAICDVEGFLSFVVPCLGRFGVGRLTGEDIAIHERLSDGWRQVPPAEVSRRFHVIDSWRSVC